MNINKQTNGTEITFTLEGRLDTTTAPALEAELSGVLANATVLKLDLSKLEYMSSAGLRVLLSAQKAMNKKGQLTIANVSAEIMEIFELTGFSDILTIV